MMICPMMTWKVVPWLEMPGLEMPGLGKPEEEVPLLERPEEVSLLERPEEVSLLERPEEVPLLEMSLLGKPGEVSLLEKNSGGCLCPWCKRMLLPGSADVEEAKETEEETRVLKQSRCAQKCGSRRVRWTWECSLCDKAPGWLQLR